MKPTVVIATRNPGKIREIRQVLGDLPFSWRSLEEYSEVPPPREDGNTFAENAALKACYYSHHCGAVALADDSGIEVDALDGAPGVRSARYAGDACDDDANNAKLIEGMRDVEPQRRTARFRCALALADGDRIIARAEGTLEGLFIDEPRGRNGFGYDPHFLVPEFGLTTAEMPPEQKNAISHRGRALLALRDSLAGMSSDPPFAPRTGL